MARPKKHTKQIHLLLTEGLDSWLEKASEEAGFSKTEFLRGLIAKEMQKK